MLTQIPLVIEDLSFRYRTRSQAAIRDISFSVAAAEILLIAGASGCGKTTLARCINGLAPRSYKGDLGGRILLQGQNTAPLTLARISQMVGTVLQDPERQILGTRVQGEVAFGLENLALSRAEILERVAEALDFLNIAHLAGRETFNLSGGEKQKVALAGVLAMRPSVLLLDEPLASLDPASAQETLAQVRRLADGGMTVVMVEHRVEDVLGIHPERVLFMQEGQIRYLGPLAGLKDKVDVHEVKLPAGLVMEKVRAAAPLPGQDQGQPELQTGAAQPFQPADQGQTGSENLPSRRANANPAPGPAAPEKPLVEFRDVHFGYDSNQEVLSGVNLSIRSGEVIAVLGPNGAGKTTLVKHAIGLLKPRRGQVLVDGRDSKTLSVAEIAARLGYVFQSPSHMLFAPTVQEELAFGPVNLRHKPAEIEKEVHEALEIVHLGGMEKNAPLSLSFGQQKRVSIAAILAMRSRILVMDEPTAGQDYQNYIEFMDAIIAMPGFEAILFITHDIDLAVVYANRVLLVNGGQLVADGPPPEVLGDTARLRANRLLPTSLLQANLDLFSRTGRFLRAEQLAAYL